MTDNPHLTLTRVCGAELPEAVAPTNRGDFTATCSRSCGCYAELLRQSKRL